MCPKVQRRHHTCLIFVGKYAPKLHPVTKGVLFETETSEPQSNFSFVKLKELLTKRCIIEAFYPVNRWDVYYQFELS